MRTIAKWASVAGVRVLDTEMRDGKWLISGLAMGTARCPECDELSSRRHGWRIRHLQDLPVQGAQVTLRVKVTRWRCQNSGCFRQTFADPLPEVAASQGRRTRRVAELARLVGHTSGGRPAERLLGCLRATIPFCATSRAMPAAAAGRASGSWGSMTERG